MSGKERSAAKGDRENPITQEDLPLTTETDRTYWFAAEQPAATTWDVYVRRWENESPWLWEGRGTEEEGCMAFDRATSENPDWYVELRAPGGEVIDYMP